MSRIQYFNIIYDRPHKFYMPGELVTGRAVLMLNDEHPLQVQGVMLELCGEARVSWNETESYKSATGKGTLKTLKRLVSLQARRDYLTTDNGGNGDNSILLQVHGQGYLHGGLEHDWPFEFQLPNGIPSSFQGRCGSIRYYIKGIVMRHNTTGNNHRTKSFFNLIAPEDCNKPQYCAPLEYVDEKRSCFYCCKTSSNPVRVKIRIDHQAYMPLDVIEIFGQFDNRSSLDVEPRVKLMQTITYKATAAAAAAAANGESCEQITNTKNVVTKIERNKLKQLHCSMIKAKTSTGWKPLQLQIPKVAPTIRNCDIISVEYHLKIQLKSMLDNDMECLFPIVIGTTPYRLHNGATVAVVREALRRSEQQQQQELDGGRRNAAYSASPATFHHHQNQQHSTSYADNINDNNMANRAIQTGKFCDYGTANRDSNYSHSYELPPAVVPSAPPAYWDLFPLPSDEYNEEQLNTSTMQPQATLSMEAPPPNYLSCP